MRSEVIQTTHSVVSKDGKKLAHQDPHGLAHGGGHEVELTCLGQPAEIAGFALSTNCRFSVVHR
jgi:hypothetical protein